MQFPKFLGYTLSGGAISSLWWGGAMFGRGLFVPATILSIAYIAVVVILLGVDMNNYKKMEEKS